MKKFLIILVLFNIALAVFGYFLPTEYIVNKSITISASPSTIHSHVGNLEKWQEWTPWNGDDPDVEITLGEKTTGIGATQKWKDKGASGSLIFTSWSPEKGIEYDLFFQDGKYTSKSSITYSSSSSNSTKVTWSLEGDTNTPIIGGYFALLMKRGIGDMFEQGLQQLKALSEN